MKKLMYMLSVNALNGLLSFLPYLMSITPLLEVCVNALNGLLSFLLETAVKKMREQNEKCQRPKRASFISTLPSQSPHKYWLCELIFADICLKILKSSIFCSFSDMFTICSYLEINFLLATT